MMRLDLPPGYQEIALAQGCAFAHARAIASAEGAGVLVWVRRDDMVDVAIVLEPDEALGEAMQVVFAGLNAAADALAVIAPPEKPLAFRWPDAVLFDGGLVGGVRLAWPESCGHDSRPDWLVLGLALRAAVPPGPTSAAPPAALIDEGFEDFAVPDFIESFSRHFMAALDEWQSRGPGSQVRRWTLRAQGGAPPGLDALAVLLTTPSWHDPTSGGIRA